MPKHADVLSTPVLSKATGSTLFRTLRSQLSELGLLKPDTRGTVLRIALWSPLFVALLAWAWTSPSLFWSGLAVLLASIVQTQFAFIGHDASHGSAAERRSGNRWAGWLTMGVVGGLCFEEWRHRHLQHHRYCQDQQRDPDMQFTTSFSLSAASRAQKVGLGRKLAPFQAYYFWPSTLLFAHSLRVMSFAAAVGSARKYRGDLIAFGLHVVLWLLLPIALLDVELLRVLLVYLVASSLLGIRLAAVFTVNHVGMPEAAKGASFLEHQVTTSRNIDNSRWFDWFFGGLNFQIEHHLMPACPRRRLRAARNIVRPGVLAAGLHHHERRWPLAVGDVTRHLGRIAKTPKPEATTEACCQPAHEA